MIRKIPYLITVLFFVALVSGCSDFQKILKSNNVDKKYEAAVNYYEKKDYYKAGLLLEELIPLLKGSAESEKAQFYFAHTQYAQKQYVLSAYYFKNFYDTYPRSQFAEEALFMHAKSLYKDSPSSNLDQSNTYTAIEALQAFVNKYPKSGWKEESEVMLGGLATKLEIKAFENAKLYHQLRYYKSAVLALENFQTEYPSSAFGEEAAFLKIDAQFSLAKESVPEKQRERFLEVINFYQAFVDKYSQSRYIKSAESLYDSAVTQLEKLKAANS